ncbi:MAG: hypothetical protein JWN70_278, partial [Planctomycetaceae bacterium]|nr:hypothetical protein [Planctomycetaceae bacterium]
LRSLTIWSLCFACLAGSAPLFVFAEPGDKDKSGKKQESAKVDSSDKSPDKKTDKKVEADARNANKSNQKVAAKNNQEMTPEREQSALDFVEQNHPKLAKLISLLKTSNPKEYQRALKELYRTSDRLAGIRTKDPARYELELDAWKLQSHVRLLAARMTMEDDPEIEQELRGMLKKKAENQLKLLQNERESLQARLKQVETQIERSSKSQDEFVQQEYDRLLKRTEREKQAFVPKANPGKPAGNKKGNVTKPADTVGVEKR